VNDRLLLDSHVALWVLGDEALGESARQAISDASVVYVSVVTPWELGIKRALGKLDYPAGLSSVLAGAGFEMLSITAEHAELAPTLPLHHRDPFDRMLISQALVQRLTLVTADEALERYDLTVLDARR
jgi:PIN domain nuclease of toxin-antitoxin system